MIVKLDQAMIPILCSKTSEAPLESASLFASAKSSDSENGLHDSPVQEHG